MKNQDYYIAKEQKRLNDLKYLIKYSTIGIFIAGFLCVAFNLIKIL